MGPIVILIEMLLHALLFTVRCFKMTGKIAKNDPPVIREVRG